MASAKLRRKTHHSDDKFLSPERTRTIKPADFKNHKQLKDLSHDDLIELLWLMEAELQAKDVLLKAVLSSETGHALPLSHLLNDVDMAHLENESEDKSYLLQEDEEDEVWLGEPSAHLNHVVAYHQVVREQMQTTVRGLQKVHEEVVEKLDEEYHKHAADTAQGDDVTYMLEKERERLQAQIDQEQTKYADLEKERDTLRETLEKERKDYYNAFNELMNDCKALAQQLVTQSSKHEKNQKDHEKHQKEVDKEKSKNKLLSELMVEETQKFKERLRQYEDEVRDFHVLEQKKNDLETKLATSDKQMKETFHQLNDERKKNSKLMFELKQLRLNFQGGYAPEDDTNEDILLVQDQYEIPIKEARTSTIQLSQPDRDSPEPSTVLPPAVPVQAKVATVTKSSSIRQTKNYSPQVNKSNNIVPLNNHAAAATTTNQRVNSPYVHAPDAQQMKRHSYEEKSSYNNSREEASINKRNSYEGVLNHTGTPETTRTSLNKKPSSYEDMRNVGGAAALSVTPKRNSYEGDSKKIPPPAPPRRGSQLTPQDRPPIVKIPQQFQPRKSNTSTSSATDAYKQQNRTNSTDEKLLMLTVVYHFGWEYHQDSGFNDGDRVEDFLSILSIKPSTTWNDLTQLMNKTFERECPTQFYESQASSACLSSIQGYQYGTTTWTKDYFPTVHFNKMLTQRIQTVTIRLKDHETEKLDDLSYSTLTPRHTLEEGLRILEHEKKLMFTVNEEIEGSYIVSVFSRWIKHREGNCKIITIDRQQCQDIMNLTNTLLNLGVLHKSEEPRLSQRYIVVINIDTLENLGVTSLIFDWLAHGIEKKKNTHYYNGNDDDFYQFHKDVILIAFATSDTVTNLSQQAYRLFKIISLPSNQHALITRWLRQKMVQYSPKDLYDFCMVNTVKWLSEVYQNLHKSFFKIELVHKLPDVSVYLDAPLNDKDELYEWVKNLWSERLTPCVEESVRHRTGAATEAQRDMLIKATLKAVFEKSIRTGCPVELKF